MKRYLFLFGVAVIFFALQTTLLTRLPIQRIRPDLVLILVLYFGFTFPIFSGGIVAFFIGFLMDLFSGNSFGLYTFTRPLIFLVAQLFRYQFYWEGFSFQFLFVLIFTFLEGLFILVLFGGINSHPLRTLSSPVLTLLLPQAICTALVTPVLLKLFNKGTHFLLTNHGLDLRGEG